MAPLRIKLCNLYSGFDHRGRPFLKGRLGDTRVIIAERANITHDGDDAATHELFILERNFRTDARRLDDTEGRSPQWKDEIDRGLK